VTKRDSVAAHKYGQNSQNSESTKSNCNSSISRGQSAIAKPFRSSSLKLRASYTNILDQLTTTTLAKLKLGSSPNSSSSPSAASSSASLVHNKQEVNLKQTKLDVVPDEPEDEVEEVVSSKRPIETGLVVATSPTSSSSGLSSAGLADVSPPLSSSSNCLPILPKVTLSSADTFPKDIDSGHSNGNSDTQFSDTEEDEQNTLVSSENMGSCGGQMRGAEKDTIAYRNNLIKTGAILAELKSLDEERESVLSSGGSRTSDYLEYPNRAGSTSKTGNIQHTPSSTNESELVLRPKNSSAGQLSIENTFFSSIDSPKPQVSDEKRLPFLDVHKSGSPGDLVANCTNSIEKERYFQNNYDDNQEEVSAST